MSDENEHYPIRAPEPEPDASICPTIKVHELKTWPEYFGRVWDGRRKAELRRDDRDFAVGDTVHLEEWSPLGPGTYTGRVVVATITDIIRDAPHWGLMAGYAILSLDVASRHDPSQSEARSPG